MRLPTRTIICKTTALADDRRSCCQPAGKVGVARMVVNGACEKIGRRSRLANPMRIRKSRRVSVIIHGICPNARHSGATTSAIFSIKFLPQSVRSAWTGGSRFAAYEDREEVFLAQPGSPLNVICREPPPFADVGAAVGTLKSRAAACGFLRNSYGGSLEMVKAFAKFGRIFLLPGYYAHERRNANAKPSARFH